MATIAPNQYCYFNLIKSILNFSKCHDILNNLIYLFHG